MAKKTTLNEVGEMLAHVVKHMATKEQVFAAHAGERNRNPTSGMKHVKLQSRVADLEEKVFGAARG